jgi:proline racemase
VLRLSQRPIETVDYHTAGEPFRIVTRGVDPLPGTTVLDRRSAAMLTHDDVRALLTNEPRGHADMYGGFVVPADAHEDGAGEHGRLGVVFFHKDGFSTACGHGTIALATWAIESGLVGFQLR